MGHWYKKDGTPCHYQEDGKDTTLRHARKQNLVPSVTTILDIVDKPGLTNYLINQHLEASFDLASRSTEIDMMGMEYTEWCKEIRQMAGEHAENARNRGSEIHNAIELFYAGDYFMNGDNPEWDSVQAVSAALSNVYGIEVGNCTPERTFATEAYGGAVDLVADNIILDFKYKSDGWETKKDGTPKKMWYDSHVSQLAAYRAGMGMPTAAVANVFISPKAEVYIHEWEPEEVERGYEYFLACLNLWKISNRF